MPITLNLTREAEQFLRAKVGKKRYGHGVYVSTLLLVEKAKEEWHKEREEREMSTKASWRRSGVNVD